MGSFINQSDLQDLFGVKNISGERGWADIDNDNNSTTITNRITRSISYAESRFKTDLMGTRYKVPTSISGNSEEFLKRIIATWAGEWLYASRGMQDNDETNKIQTLLEQAIRDMRNIKNGLLRLDIPLSHSGPTVPVVVSK